MTINDLKVAIYADGADVKGMLEMREKGFIKGFTTNPTLMKKAGVKDYISFAEEVLKEIKDVPVSFEVFSDEMELMEKEARRLSGLGDNVYVKIPVMNTKGEATYELVRKLSSEGMHLNVTAVFTMDQVTSVVEALNDEVESIVSLFCGRIADAGVDARVYAREAAAICSKNKGAKLLWASCREVYNIIEADEAGADIITVTNDILKKLGNIGKDLEQFSRETVQMFSDDGKSLGFSIL